MSSPDIQKRVHAVIMEVLKVKEAALTPSAALKQDLHADSLDLVTLMMAFENEFGQSISDQEAASLNTVGDIIALIASRAPAQ